MIKACVVTVAVALVLSAAIYLFERWRLAKPGGPYAASDFTGIVLLLSLLGGWAVFMPTVTDAAANKLLWLWVSGVIVFVIGAITDQIQPVRGLRAVAAFLAAWLLYRSGIAIETVKLPFSTDFVALGTGGLVVSMIWLAFSGSLFARAGSIPRVSIGIGALSGLTFALIGVVQPTNVTHVAQFVSVCIALVCLALLPFTSYLTHRSATAGSYLLGVLIGAVAIEGAMKNTAFLVALLPLLLIGVPLFASLYAWAIDIVRGQSDGIVGRRNPHLYDLLIEQGYSRLQTSVVLLLGATILCVTAAILVALIEISFVVKALVLVAGLAAALLIPYVVLRLMDPAHPAAPADAYELFGVRIHSVTMDEAMDMVRRFIEADSPHIIVTTDAGGIMRARDDEQMQQIMNNADLVTADGAGVVLAARLLNLAIPTRVAGCDMISRICAVAADMGRSVYLLGAAPGVAQKAADNLCQQIPDLQIAGTHHGYFDEDEEEQIIEEIRQTRPAALFVALGAPKQEKWIVKHMERLGVPVCIGIGGSFDVIAGVKQRAPVWMQRAGLEWLYRTMKEPKRVTRLAALPGIIWLTFAELLRAPDQRDAGPAQNHKTNNKQV
ncbi:MAG: WecB/TagA/CpsF family glycosyltransferase [Armatimonadota bacterium]